MMTLSVAFAWALFGCQSTTDDGVSITEPQPVTELPFDLAGPTDAPDPSQWGPFEVGVQTLWIDDPNRENEAGEPFTIPVEVWYPAKIYDESLKSYAFDSFIPTEFLESEGISPDSLLPIQSRSYEYAPADNTHGPYPLVVFSHGNGGMRFQSLYYTELLASHGYVVASPDHVGNTLSDALTREGNFTDFVLDAIPNRVADIEAIADHLLGQQEPFAIIDETYGMTGHSLGALTSFRMAALDNRITAVVPQAPVNVSYSLIGTDYGPHNLTVPILIQAADQDLTLNYDEHAVPSFEQLPDTTAMVTYLNAGHFSFSDLCRFDFGDLQEIIYDNYGDAFDDGCGDANPSADDIHPLINFHAVGFLNGILRNSEPSLERIRQGPEQSHGVGFRIDGTL